MREILKEIILEFHDKGIPEDLIDRDINIDFINMKKFAKIIVGPRRAGKTYFLFQIMKAIKKPINNFVYINFEDNRLIDFTYKNFEDILKAYYELYPEKKPFLFLDEIHNINKWEFFVRRLVDGGFEVFLTGSNSHLLSKEYATKLGGRYVEILIFPLSFKEFLKFKNFKYGKNIIYSKKKFLLLKYFNEYLKFGGFPGIVNLDENKKFLILKQYFNTVVYKDIVARYSLKDAKILDLLIKKLSENVTNPFSFRSIVKKFKLLGFNTNVKTLSKYYEHLIDAYFIINSVQKKQSFKEKEMERKCYFVDNGYLSLFYVYENKPKLLENLVAIYLYKKKEHLFYYRERGEVDFVDPDIQVTWELNEENKKREIENFLKFLKERKGKVIS